MSVADILAPETEIALTAEFLALRERAHDAAQRAARLRFDGAPGEEIWEAERAAREAEEAAFQRYAADAQEQTAEAQERANAERERERLAEQESATIGRIVRALRDRGPMTGGELESLRIRGASHNSLRPLLRTAADQGLVVRRQDGRRVLWSPTPRGTESIHLNGLT